jgi:hypothetical protein
MSGVYLARVRYEPDCPITDSRPVIVAHTKPARLSSSIMGQIEPAYEGWLRPDEPYLGLGRVGSGSAGV